MGCPICGADTKNYNSKIHTRSKKHKDAEQSKNFKNRKILLLTVSEAKSRDIIRGKIRINRDGMNEIGIKEGEIVEVIGEKRTTAVTKTGFPEDSKKKIIRMDAIIRDNAGVKLGDEVQIRKADVKNAKSIVLTPKNDSYKLPKEYKKILRQRISGFPLTLNDTIPIPILGKLLLFTVSSLDPKGIVLLGKQSEIIVLNEQRYMKSEDEDIIVSKKVLMIIKGIKEKQFILPDSKDLLHLTVQKAKYRDNLEGKVRIDIFAMHKIGVSTGDPVEIFGINMKTTAIAWPSYPEDINKGIISMDRVTQVNCGVTINEKVYIRRAEVCTAKSILFTQTNAAENQLVMGDEQFMKSKLLGFPLQKGDIILIPVLGRATPFVVENTNPEGIVMVNDDTEIKVSDEIFND